MVDNSWVLPDSAVRRFPSLFPTELRSSDVNATHRCGRMELVIQWTSVKYWT